LDEAGVKSPIHVFGALDPLTVCLYFVAGAEVFDGQQVGPDHLVIDGDLVELHL
jgi:hypothetical protein